MAQDEYYIDVFEFGLDKMYTILQGLDNSIIKQTYDLLMKGYNPKEEYDYGITMQDFYDAVKQEMVFRNLL